MIIILNGPPSAGKSSIARALIQQSKTTSLKHIEADNIFHRDDEPVKVVITGNTKISYYLSTLEKIDIALKAGSSVIWEDVFVFKDQLQCQLSAINNKKIVYFFRIICDLEICKSRELSREQSCGIGVVESLYPFTHIGMPYFDLEIDSSSTLPEVNAAIILNFVRNNPQPTAFKNYRPLCV